MAGVDSYTVLMLHCTGVDGSTTFTDSSPVGQTVTAAGDAQIDTAVSKFDGASAQFGYEYANRLEFQDIDAWNFGTGDFTISFWIYKQNTSTYGSWITRYDSSTNSGIKLSILSTNKIEFYVIKAGSYVVKYTTTSAVSISNNTWTNIEFCRYGTGAFLFVDGVSQDLTVTNAFGYQDIDIGFDYQYMFAGSAGSTYHVDEIKIDKGIARHTSNFTPATAPFFSAYSESVSESLSIAESVAATIVAEVSLSEGISAVDADQGTLFAHIEVDESIVAEQTTDCILSIPETIDEEINIEPVMSNSLIALDTLDDILAVFDDMDAGSVYLELLAELLGISGYINTLQFDILNDSVNIEDAAVVERSIPISLSETLFSWETTGVGWNVPVAESLVATDSASYVLAVAIHDWLRAVDAVTPNWIGSESISESISVSDILAAIKVYNDTIAESIVATDTITAKLAFVVAEYLRFVETVTGTGVFPKDISESLTLTDAVLFPAIELSILESLGFTEVVSAVLGVISMSVSDTMTAEDSAAPGWFKTISDAFAAVDSASVVTLFLDTIAEALVATDTASPILTISESMTESLVVSEVAVANGVFGVVVYDTLRMALTVELDGEVYECYVLNTGKFLPSVYSGFDFNSYAVFEGRAFAANSTGIFELTGSTDNGSTIHTGIILPETKFGATNHKRMRKAYLGISGTRPVMQMEIEDGTTRTFEIDTDGEVDGNRDMKSKAWKLTVADFESLDFIKLFPVVLSK